MYNTLLELKKKNIFLDLDVLANAASNLPKVGGRRCAVSSCDIIDKKRKFHRFPANPHLSLKSGLNDDTRTYQFE